MKVTAKIVANFEDEGKLKAIATVCLDGRFLVTGVRIVDCKKGLVVFMPSRKTEDGSYKDICFPIKPELHKQIKETVLAAYANPPEHDEPAVSSPLGEQESSTVQWTVEKVRTGPHP